MTVSDSHDFGKLMVVAGPDEQREFDLEGLAEKKRLSFGRHHSCDFVLSHPTVSREHFALELSGSCLLLVDSLSGNGTFVNGERVTWVELKPGDKIQAGPFVMIAKLANRTESTAETESDGSREYEEIEQPAGAFGREHLSLYPNQYLLGIMEFNRGRYFEAHELWEEIWLRSEGQARSFYQALIHAAVALHHHSKGNPRGAVALYERLVSRAEVFPAVYMSLVLKDVARQVEAVIRPVKSEPDDSESEGSSEATRPQIRLMKEGWPA